MYLGSCGDNYQYTVKDMVDHWYIHFWDRKTLTNLEVVCFVFFFSPINICFGYSRGKETLNQIVEDMSVN